MEEYKIEEINDAIEEKSQFITDIQNSIHNVIIGQDELIEKLILYA